MDIQVNVRKVWGVFHYVYDGHVLHLRKNIMWWESWFSKIWKVYGYSSKCEKRLGCFSLCYDGHVLHLRKNITWSIYRATHVNNNILSFTSLLSWEYLWIFPSHLMSKLHICKISRRRLDLIPSWFLKISLHLTLKLPLSHDIHVVTTPYINMSSLNNNLLSW